MKKTRIITGIILVLLICWGFFIFQTTKNNPLFNDRRDKIPSINKYVSQNTVSCTDYDGGENIYVKGRAICRDNNGETLHVTEDFCAKQSDQKDPDNNPIYQIDIPLCSGDNCYVREGYCGEYQNTVIDKEEYIQCPNGCKDGTCLPKQ